MKTLVEDAELQELRAMADGSKAFRVIPMWERLAAKEFKEINAFPPREKLAVGYYTAAQRRAESLKG